MKNPIHILLSILAIFILSSMYIRNVTCPCGTTNGTLSAATPLKPFAKSVVALDNVAHIASSKEFIVNFDSNARQKAQKQQLTELINYLKTNGKYAIVVTGHADSRGTVAYNQKLSESRAAFVMSQLVRQGINSTQITAIGQGEHQPVASNTTKEGRKSNRRVVIKILEYQNQDA